MVGFVLLCYVLGVIIGQPEIPLSMNGMPTKFSGESAFALMSLLGATIMPHNFYLHSSIVQVAPSLLYVSVCVSLMHAFMYPPLLPFYERIYMILCMHACLGRESTRIIVTKRTQGNFF